LQKNFGDNMSNKNIRAVFIARQFELDEQHPGLVKYNKTILHISTAMKIIGILMGAWASSQMMFTPN